MIGNVTDKKIRSLQSGKRITYLWDTHLRGFGVRVSPTSVSYQIQRDGRRQAYSARNAVEARQRAFEVLATPIPGAPQSAVLDLSRAWETYIQERGTDTRYWRELNDRFTKHVLPTLELTKNGIREALAKKSKTPAAKRTLWEGLSPFCKWLVANDYIQHNPMGDLIAPRVPASRDRTLTDQELARVWRACTIFDRHPNTPHYHQYTRMELWGPIFQLLILTAQRRNEVSGLSYLEIEGSEWTIPKERTKNGKTHLVHLAPAARQILNSNPPFIGRNVSGFSKALIHLKQISGINNFRIHDLRRTAATGMQRLGIPPHIVDRVLNHYQGDPYQRFQYVQERRQALEAWATFVLSLGSTT